MFSFVDSIIVFSNLERAVAELAALDTDHTLLEWDEETGTPLPFFHARNRVFNWAGGKPPMCACRFTVDKYLRIREANITGFSFLGAGYAEDDIEQMFLDGEMNFTRWEIDDRTLESVRVNISLEDDPIRIPPTPAAIAVYRTYHPAIRMVEGENGLQYPQDTGRFFRF